MRVVMQWTLTLSVSVTHLRSGRMVTSKPLGAMSLWMRLPTWSASRIFLPLKRSMLVGFRWSGWPWLNQMYGQAAMSSLRFCGMRWESTQLPK